MLVDVFSKGVTGKVAEAALGKAGITVNKNAIPFDQNPPMVASGIRIGTPAMTTRGMREPEMDAVGELIAPRARRSDDDRVAADGEAGSRSALQGVPAVFELGPAKAGRSASPAKAGHYDDLKHGHPVFVSVPVACFAAISRWTSSPPPSDHCATSVKCSLM